MTNDKQRQGLSTVVIISVIVVAFGALYLLTPHSSTTPIQTQITEQKPVTDSSNWTVYTNPTYSYSIKFPANYQVPPQTAKEKSQLGVDNNISLYKINPSVGDLIIIDVSQNPNNLSLEDYMNENSKLYGITGPLVSYSFNNYDSLLNKNQPGTNVFVKYGQYIYHITAPTASSDKEIGDIVNTFKFTI
ncbi:MAG: hypothetical protein WCV93_05250 [Candidatus Shapirobacteria bacterium]|jgi:hypothetical protein